MSRPADRPVDRLVVGAFRLLGRFIEHLHARRRAILAAVGCLSAALAGVFLASPGYLGPIASIGESMTQGTVVYVAFSVGLVGVWMAASELRDRTVDDAAVGVAGVAGSGPEVRRSGEDVDERLDGLGQVATPYQIHLVRTTYERLLSVAVDALCEAHGLTEPEARRRIDAGTWTDDPLAATFLGSVEYGDQPLAWRIRQWARGELVARQIEATVAELAALSGDAWEPGGERDPLGSPVRPAWGPVEESVARVRIVADEPTERDETRSRTEETATEENA